MVRLKELREAAGLTQSQLGEIAGVKQGRISEIETGAAQRIELAMLERLARALKVPASELIVETPAKAAGKRRK